MEFAGEYTEFKESKISSGRFNHKRKKNSQANQNKSSKNLTGHNYDNQPI